MKFLALSVCILLCGIIVKEKSRTFGLLVSVSGIVMVFVSVSGEIYQLVYKVKELTAAAPSTLSYVKLMFKVLALTLLTQILSDICRDNGENALAGITETAAKLVIISMVFPLFEAVISIVGGLVK